MEVLYGLLASSDGPCALALGNFDGIHPGHRKVLSLALQSGGLKPAVLTFDLEPPDGWIFSQKRKISILESMGFERMYLLHFASVRDMTAKEFVDALSESCRVKKACCGFNFTFGSGGKAGSAELQKLCAERGMEAAVAEPVLWEGAPVSSSRVRGLIGEGRVEEASRLLPCPFGYESPVLPGRRLGRRLGAPTLNQALPDHLVKPKFGVYVSAVYFGGNAYAGVTNVGVRPTVGSNTALAETWMPEYRGGDLYGRTARVDLLRFLRPEIRFPNLKDLKEAILGDGKKAEEYFKKNAIPRPFPDFF